LLLNDSYLPGVQVLAHSLRDGGTTKRLAVLVTLSTVSEATVEELKRLYDYVIPVDPIQSSSSDGLQLMGRPDLHSALTKIHLWNQTQFRKIVYIDADVLAMRPPDELFDIDAEFAASPDVGWPDCFNSGVMMLKPNVTTHGELTEKAARGESFDGADQGLLNQHFENWHRLPFSYNCTVGSSMSYQYAPAYKHYGSKVSMIHFIGNAKPWDRGTVPGLSESPDPYDRLSGHWWAVWNKHRSPVAKNVGSQPQMLNSPAPSKSVTNFEPTAPPPVNLSPQNEKSDSSVPPAVSRLVEKIAQSQGTAESKKPDESKKLDVNPESFTHFEQHVHGCVPEVVHTPDGPVDQKHYFKTGPDTYYIQKWIPEPPEPPKPEKVQGENKQEEKEMISNEPEEFSAPRTDWDPTKSGPPVDSLPEARNLQFATYTNEWDNMDTHKNTGLFVAPPLAPVPTKHLWYQIPDTIPEAPDALPNKPLFPWEQRPHTVTRVFADDARSDTTRSSRRLSSGSMISDADSEETMTAYTNDDAASRVMSPAEKSWSSYTVENKWDTDPAIRDYVVGIQRRQSNVSDKATVVPGTRPEVPRIPRAPVVRKNSIPWKTTGEQEKWARSADEICISLLTGLQDPERKFEELKQLPQKFVNRVTRDESNQTETQAKGYEPTALEIIVPPVPEAYKQNYRDSSVQTEKVVMKSQGTQWDPNDVVRTRPKTPFSSQVSVWNLPPYAEKMPVAIPQTPFRDERIDLRSIAGIPRGV
ncbi:nucleotide-diphospho-sugar transferase, partial [Geopyxis carbonaria]